MDALKGITSQGLDRKQKETLNLSNDNSFSHEKSSNCEALNKEYYDKEKEGLHSYSKPKFSSVDILKQKQVIILCFFEINLLITNKLILDER